MKSENKRHKHWELKSPCLILCEGKDAERFLIELLVFHIRQGKKNWDNIQVFDYGGIKELTNGLNTVLQTPGIEALESILILRDSEKNAAGAAQSIGTSLDKVKLDRPCAVNTFTAGSRPTVAFSLFPNFDAQEDGTLEDLCMRLICEECYPRLSGDIGDFIDKIENAYQRPPFHRHKSQLHTYFSISDGLIGLKLGEAAKTGAYDLTSQALAPLFKLFDEMTARIP